MPERGVNEKLNQAIDAMLAYGGSATAAAPDAELAPFVRIAAELRGLPGENFKATLKADLIRRATMASNAASVRSESEKTGTAAVSYVREGFHTIAPCIQVNGAAKFIEFLEEAFGAEERVRVPEPDGTIRYAEVKIADSMLQMGDGNEQFPVSPAAMHFYVDDVDATYARAIEAGAISTHAPVDQPYGDREAGIKDPFGNSWFIATPKTYTPFPGQMNAIQPYLFLRDAEKMIPFLESAFSATAEGVHKSPEGKVAHATVRIGDNTLELSEEHGEYRQSVRYFHLYVPDTDAVYAQALRAGATSLDAPNDKPYGDRSAGVRDPWGNNWFIATHIKDVSFREAHPELHHEERINVEASKKEGRVAEQKPKTTGVNYIREGFRTVSPYILVSGAAKFIDFLKEAFGAVERGRVPLPNGKIMHAEVQLGDSVIEMSDGNEQYGPSPVTIHLTVPDAEAAYRRALEAGAMSLSEPRDQFWGQYEAGVRDPFGNEWYITPPEPEYPQPAVQPYLHLHDAEKMIAFLEAAFGAKAEGVHKWPGGAIAHATVLIGDGQIEIDEAFRANRQTQCHLHLYVPDTDAVYAQALRAGATTIEAPSDKPYGDRSAGVKDAWGNSWFIATHIKDVAF